MKKEKRSFIREHVEIKKRHDRARELVKSEFHKFSQEQFNGSRVVEEEDSLVFISVQCGWGLPPPIRIFCLNLESNEVDEFEHSKFEEKFGYACWLRN